MDILTDDWSESGHSFRAFKDLCLKLDSCYDYIKVCGSEISLLSVKPSHIKLGEFDAKSKLCIAAFNSGLTPGISICDAHTLLAGKNLFETEDNGRITLLEETVSEDEKTIKVNYLNRGSPVKTDPATGSTYIPSTRVNKSSSEEFKMLCSETLRPHSIMLLIDKKIYFTSSTFLSTFKQRIKISGPALLEPSLERNVFLSRYLPDETYTLIFLSYGPYRKAFALCSEDYSALPVSAYLRFISDLGTDSILGHVEFNSYYFSHLKKDVFLSFPDYGKELSEKYGTPGDLIPGLLIRTSDTGNSSFEVSGIWYYHGTYFRQCMAPIRMHRFDFTLDGLLGEIENDIYLRFEELPMQLKAIDHSPLPSINWKQLFDGICDERIAGKKVLGRIAERLNRISFSSMPEAVLKAVEISLKEEMNGPAQEELRKSVVKIIFKAQV